MKILALVYHVTDLYAGEPHCLGSVAMDSAEARRIVAAASGEEWFARPEFAPFTPICQTSTSAVGGRIEVAQVVKELAKLSEIFHTVEDGLGEDWEPSNGVYVNWASDWSRPEGEHFVRFTIESTANWGIASQCFSDVEKALDFLIERAHDFMVMGFSVKLSITTGEMEAEFTTYRKESVPA